MLDLYMLYEILYALAASGGREKELFGSCANSARAAFAGSLVSDAFPELWSGKHDDEQGEGAFEQPELQSWTPARHQRHQLTHQVGIAEALQALFLLPVGDQADQGQ